MATSETFISYPVLFWKRKGGSMHV